MRSPRLAAPFSREDKKDKGRELSPVLPPCLSLVEKKKGLKKRIIRARRIALGDVASSFHVRKLVAGRRRNSSNDGGKEMDREIVRQPTSLEIQGSDD